MEPLVLAALAAATLAGALVQAATGFGFAIIAAPVFLMVTGSTGSMLVLVALHLVQSVLAVPQVMRLASRWHLRRLLLGAAAGCPIGLFLFQAADTRTLKLGVGVVIVLVIALLLLRERITLRHPVKQRSRSHGTVATMLTGLVSGALTALLVMPGPPLMLYFMTERRAADAIRALSLTFFAVCYLAVTVSGVVVIGLSRSEMLTIGMLAPAVVLGTLAGNGLAPKLSDGSLRRAILGLMLLSGIGAIASALFQ